MRIATYIFFSPNYTGILDIHNFFIHLRTVPNIPYPLPFPLTLIINLPIPVSPYLSPSRLSIHPYLSIFPLHPILLTLTFTQTPITFYPRLSPLYFCPPAVFLPSSLPLSLPASRRMLSCLSLKCPRAAWSNNSWRAILVRKHAVCCESLDNIAICEVRFRFAISLLGRPVVSVCLRWCVMQ